MELKLTYTDGEFMKDIYDLLSITENKKMLVVFPHPDDETVMAAGLMNHAIKRGWQVKVVSVTNGVMGRVHVHGKGRSVVQIRREELAGAMRILGVSDVNMWRYCDGMLRDIDLWQEPLAELLRTFDPAIVVSYGPCGVSGHPDHLALGKWVFEYMKKHYSKKFLLWPSFSGAVRNWLELRVKTVERLCQGCYQLQLNAKLKELKQKAIKAHKSQKLTHPLKWMELSPTEEFAVADYKKSYDFSYVEFDLGD